MTPQDNTNVAAAITYKLSPNTEATVLSHILELIKCNHAATSIRTRFEKCDKLVYRQPDKESGKKDLEFTVPIISPLVDSMKAYLAATFISTSSVFPITTAPGSEQLATTYNLLLDNFAQEFQWKRNLVLALDDSAVYNAMFVEATWKEVKVGSLTNETSPNGKAVKTKKVTKAGFSIKHLDPYNTMWDTTVTLADLAAEGEFAGYVEQYTRMGLHRFLLSLPEDKNFSFRKKDILDGKGQGTRHYYTPSISPENTTSSGSNWLSTLAGKPLSNGKNEVLTMYVRIVPSDFGITNVPNSGTPQIWKFVIVNSAYIVYAEARTNAHDYLPIVAGQPRESNLGYQSQSIPEELESLQRIASSFWSAEIASTRRLLSDRALFDPDMIREEDLKNAGETGKIPVRNKGIDKSLNQAYYPIPYSDPALGQRSGIANQLSQFGFVVTGQNQVSNGQFVKGNKTNSQFDEVLRNSDARQIVMALLLADQFFAPLKTILKSDLLQYQEPTTIYDFKTGQAITIDPVMLRDSKVMFEVNDKLTFADDELDAGELITFFQTLQSSEQLQQAFDLPKVLVHLMHLRGVKGLDAYIVKQVPPPQGVAPQQPLAPTDPNAIVDQASYQEAIAGALPPEQGGADVTSPPTA